MAEKITGENIVKAFDVLMNKRFDELALDKTIVATIEKPLAPARDGSHQVQYAGGSFVAYSQNNQAYLANTTVYVQVPQNDFSKKKIILGLASSYRSQDDIEIVSSIINDYMPLGNNVMTLKNNNRKESGYGLNSYSEAHNWTINGVTYPQFQDSVLLYDREDPQKSQYDMNLNALETYVKNAKAIMLQADFRTVLTEEQQKQAEAEYGLIFELAFKNTSVSYKNNEEMLLDLGKNVKALKTTTNGVEYYIDMTVYKEELDTLFRDENSWNTARYTGISAVLTYLTTISSNVKALMEANENEMSSQEAQCFGAFSYMITDLIAVQWQTDDNGNKDDIKTYKVLYNMYHDYLRQPLVDEQEIEKHPVKILSYTLNSSKMAGNPFYYKTFNSQYAIFPIDVENFLYINKIYFYCNGFISNETMWDWVDKNRYKIQDYSTFSGEPASKAGFHGKDIWVRDVSFYALQEIQSEYGDYKFKYETPDGTKFYTVDGSETLRVKTKIMYKEYSDISDDCSLYWFKKDSRVNNIQDERYHMYGGKGWACLDKKNDYSIFWDFNSADNKAWENEYMVVAVYNNAAEGTIVLRKTFILYNEACKRNIKIDSNKGFNFVFSNSGTEHPTLICSIEGKTENFEEGKDDSQFKFYWTSVDSTGKQITFDKEYNTLKELRDLAATYEERTRLNLEMTDYYEVSYPKGINGNQLTYPVKNINNAASITFTCQVFMTDSINNIDNPATWYCIGSAEATINNKGIANVNEYRVTFTNGDQVFQYSESGVAPTEKDIITPTNFRHTDPIEIKSVRPHLISPTGVEIDEGSYTIEWRYPLENSLIIPPTEKLLPNSLDGNVNALREREATFDIAKMYDYDLYDNQIECFINFSGETYHAKTNFYFGKIGDNGTNGTDIVCRIQVMNVGNRLDNEPLTLYITDQGFDQDRKWNIGNNSDPILQVKLYNKAIELEEIPTSVSWKILGGEKNSFYFTLEPNVDTPTQATLSATATQEGKESRLYYNQLVQVSATLASTGQTYYAVYPVCIVSGHQNNISTLIDKGISFDYNSLLKQVLYNNDGTRPLYNQNQGVGLNGISYHYLSWTVDGGHHSYKYNETSNEWESSQVYYNIPITLTTKKEDSIGELVDDIKETNELDSFNIPTTTIKGNGIDKVWVIPNEQCDCSANDTRVVARIYESQAIEDTIQRLKTELNEIEVEKSEYLTEHNNKVRQAQANKVRELAEVETKRLNQINDFIDRMREEGYNQAVEDHDKAIKDIEETLYNNNEHPLPDEYWSYINTTFEETDYDELSNAEVYDRTARKLWQRYTQIKDECLSKWAEIEWYYEGEKYIDEDGQEKEHSHSKDEDRESELTVLKQNYDSVLEEIEEWYTNLFASVGELKPYSEYEVDEQTLQEFIDTINIEKENSISAINNKYDAEPETQEEQSSGGIFWTLEQNKQKYLSDWEENKQSIIADLGRQKQDVITLSIPIYMSVNTFGLASLNAWNGNSIDINEEGQYIMAPQIGAGEKDSKTNTFTGMVMGVVDEYADASGAKRTNKDDKTFYYNENKERIEQDAVDNKKIGLLGFAKGKQSIYLSARTGNAFFGLPENEQLWNDEDDYKEGRIELIPGGISKIGGWRLGRRNLYYTKTGDLSNPYFDKKLKHQHDIGSEDTGILLNALPNPYLSIKGRPLKVLQAGETPDGESYDIDNRTGNAILKSGDSLEINLDPDERSPFTIYRHYKDSITQEWLREPLVGIDAFGRFYSNSLRDKETSLAMDFLGAFGKTVLDKRYAGLLVGYGQDTLFKAFISAEGAITEAQKTIDSINARITARQQEKEDLEETNETLESENSLKEITVQNLENTISSKLQENEENQSEIWDNENQINTISSLLQQIKEVGDLTTLIEELQGSLNTLNEEKEALSEYNFTEDEVDNFNEILEDLRTQRDNVYSLQNSEQEQYNSFIDILENETVILDNLTFEYQQANQRYEDLIAEKENPEDPETEEEQAAREEKEQAEQAMINQQAIVAAAQKDVNDTNDSLREIENQITQIESDIDNIELKLRNYERLIDINLEIAELTEEYNNAEALAQYSVEELEAWVNELQEENSILNNNITENNSVIDELREQIIYNNDNIQLNINRILNNNLSIENIEADLQRLQGQLLEAKEAKRKAEERQTEEGAAYAEDSPLYVSGGPSNNELLRPLKLYGQSVELYSGNDLNNEEADENYRTSSSYISISKDQGYIGNPDSYLDLKNNNNIESTLKNTVGNTTFNFTGKTHTEYVGTYTLQPTSSWTIGTNNDNKTTVVGWLQAKNSNIYLNKNKQNITTSLFMGDTTGIILGHVDKSSANPGDLSTGYLKIGQGSSGNNSFSKFNSGGALTIRANNGDLLLESNTTISINKFNTNKSFKLLSNEDWYLQNNLHITNALRTNNAIYIGAGDDQIGTVEGNNTTYAIKLSNTGEIHASNIFKTDKDFTYSTKLKKTGAHGSYNYQLGNGIGQEKISDMIKDCLSAAAAAGNSWTGHTHPFKKALNVHIMSGTGGDKNLGVSSGDISVSLSYPSSINVYAPVHENLKILTQTSFTATVKGSATIEGKTAEVYVTGDVTIPSNLYATQTYYNKPRITVTTSTATVTTNGTSKTISFPNHGPSGTVSISVSSGKVTKNEHKVEVKGTSGAANYKDDAHRILATTF